MTEGRALFQLFEKWNRHFQVDPVQSWFARDGEIFFI